MPRPKKYETETDRKRAYNAAVNDRLELNIKRDAPINKAVLQKAAEACGISLARLLLEGAGRYIADELGLEWLEENKNKPSGEGEKK